MRPSVTFLTNPIIWGLAGISEIIRFCCLALRHYFFGSLGFYDHPLYRGHAAVTRSLVEGLKKEGKSFNYNPRYVGQLSDVVVVLAGIGTLRQAIRLKKKGIIKTLLAGPNIVEFASDSDLIIASPEIDKVITPSEWVTRLYINDAPGLSEKIYSWPAGVNCEYWCPASNRKRDHILIFDKRNIGDDPDHTRPYVDFLNKLGWKVDVINRCGTQQYTADQYRSYLRKSCLMLGFTIGSESQGIAWAEAWACDVPTLIKQCNYNTYNNRYFACSSSPYLNSHNGLFFVDFEDFKGKFSYWERNRLMFSPRKWVLENISDEVSSTALFNLAIECTKGK